MVSRLVAFLFVFVLVAGVPALSFLTTRQSQLRQIPRLSLYLSAALSEWLLAGLGLLVFLISRPRLAVGFRGVAPAALTGWAGVLVALSLGGLGVSLLLERRGWWPRESELVYLLLPETRAEKLWSVLILAPTAAFCEEFLYRGYFLAQLGQWCHSLFWAWGGSSIAFGLAHVYQGWSGMLRAAALGALLAFPVVRLGSLYPSMIAHGLIDAVALVYLGPKFLREGTLP
jgi:membrane protease YdiL (CAAX protease family)